MAPFDHGPHVEGLFEVVEMKDERPPEFEPLHGVVARDAVALKQPFRHRKPPVHRARPFDGTAFDEHRGLRDGKPRAPIAKELADAVVFEKRAVVRVPQIDVGLDLANFPVDRLLQACCKPMLQRLFFVDDRLQALDRAAHLAGALAEKRHRAFGVAVRVVAHLPNAHAVVAKPQVVDHARGLLERVIAVAARRAVRFK